MKKLLFVLTVTTGVLCQQTHAQSTNAIQPKMKLSLAGTMQLSSGIAGVSPALVGVPPTQIERTSKEPNGSLSPRVEAIGETPMAATGTVAIPFSTESFRLS